MSTSEILEMISTGSYVVAGISFALVLFFWFRFKIPQVIGDLSGRTAKKSIAKMRETNEKTGKKSYKSSKTNLERGLLTGTIPDMGKDTQKNVDENIMPETGLLDENKVETYDDEQTALLDNEETGLLTQEHNDIEETGLLVDENETMLLETDEQPVVKRVSTIKVELIEEIMLIHTDEVI